MHIRAPGMARPRAEGSERAARARTRVTVRHSASRMGRSYCTWVIRGSFWSRPVLPGRLAPSCSGVPIVPHLRTAGRTVRNSGTVLAHIIRKVPNLRTLGRTVRNSGTLLVRLVGKVPSLRTHGRTVRRFGTLRRRGAARPRRSADEKGCQTSETACVCQPCTHTRRFRPAIDHQTSETACMGTTCIPRLPRTRRTGTLKGSSRFYSKGRHDF